MERAFVERDEVGKEAFGRMVEWEPIVGDLGVLIDADHRHPSLVFYVRKEQGEVHRPNRSDSLDQ